jgi:hypothetical protein
MKLISHPVYFNYYLFKKVIKKKNPQIQGSVWDSISPKGKPAQQGIARPR